MYLEIDRTLVRITRDHIITWEVDGKRFRGRIWGHAPFNPFSDSIITVHPFNAENKDEWEQVIYSDQIIAIDPLQRYVPPKLVEFEWDNDEWPNG